MKKWFKLSYTWLFNGGYSSSKKQLNLCKTPDDVVKFVSNVYVVLMKKKVTHWTQRKFLSMAGQRVPELAAQKWKLNTNLAEEVLHGREIQCIDANIATVAR